MPKPTKKAEVNYLANHSQDAERRVTACLRACAGATTEALEKHGTLIVEIGLSKLRLVGFVPAGSAIRKAG
jgi:hypothetical protein